MRTKKAREKTPRLLQGLAGFLQKKRWAWLSPGTKSIRAWKTKEGGEGVQTRLLSSDLYRRKLTDCTGNVVFPTGAWTWLPGGKSCSQLRYRVILASNLHKPGLVGLVWFEINWLNWWAYSRHKAQLSCQFPQNIR